MPLFLVRHVKAGSRSDWQGAHPLRPGSREGRIRADGITSLLVAQPITRILSSPSVRCVQSVEPLAAKLGIEVETVRALAEATSTSAGLKLLRSLADVDAVLCSHGDVIPSLL